MTVHEMNPRQRDERTEHRRRIERAVGELRLIGEALDELSRGHGALRLLRVLAKSQQRQIDDLSKLLAYVPGAGSAAARPLGDFDDDIPF